MRNQFRLESLLKYRKSVEEKIQIELAELREKQFKEEEKLSKIKDIQRSILKRSQGGNKIDDIAYLESLSNEYIYRKKILTNLANKITETQNRLMSASKARKILEKLKDRKMKEHKTFLINQENKLMDEMAGVRFIRAEE